MGNYKEDTDQNIGTILFLSLFSLFVLSTSNIQGNHNSSSKKFTVQTELVFGDNSNYHSAIISSSVRFSDILKYCEFVPQKTSLNQFSIQYKISDFNRRIAQNFIAIQKRGLEIEPLFLWRLFHPCSLAGNEDLPVLS